MTVSVKRAVGLGWVGSGSGQSAIAGRLRPRRWWSFSSCLRRALVGLVEQQDGQRQQQQAEEEEEEEEGKEDDRYGSAQCRRALHGAGWTSSVQQ